MSSCEFLNVAHAALVEEFMRTRMVKGITIPGLPLEDALEHAKIWSEGFSGELPPAVEDDEKPRQAQPSASGEKTEEEIVAQNEVAMQALMGRMASVKGGFSLRPAKS